MLSIIQVGHNDASDRYVRNKVKAIKEAGLQADVVHLPEKATTEDVLRLIRVFGYQQGNPIMVQLPLPEHIDKAAVLSAIPAELDIDGLNPKSDYKPLTPCAIMRWLDEQGIDLVGKNVAILGRSELVGKPLANMMIDAGATVTVCNSHTSYGREVAICIGSDIIVSAVGVPEHVTTMMIHNNRKYDAVIDVGINRHPTDGHLCGDVSADARWLIVKNGGICTPVPGGVGRWTVRELVLRLKEMEGES